MHIPHPSRTLLPTRIRDIPLHDDRSGASRLGREHHIADFDDALVACGPDLDDGRGVGLVGEGRAAADDCGPDFADDDGADGDFDSFGDVVGSGVEVDDLAARVLVEDGLDGGAVVGYAITNCALCFDRYEFW